MQFCLYCGTLLTADACPLCGSGDPTPAQVYALLRAARAYVPRYGDSWHLYRALHVVLCPEVGTCA